MAGIHSYLPPPQWRESLPTLPPEESAHIVAVMRAGTGDTLHIFDGEGQTGTARILSPHKKHATLEILTTESHQLSTPRKILIQALVREQRMDIILQKAVELGIHEIRPIHTTNCVVKLGPAEAQKKLIRWNTILLNACKQSGNPFLPKISLPTSLETALTTRPPAACFGALLPQTRRLSDFLHQQTAQQPWPDAIAAFIGPEGDFTVDEYQQLLDSGATPVSFGPLILRSETAAIFAMSAFLLAFMPD